MFLRGVSLCGVVNLLYVLSLFVKPCFGESSLHSKLSRTEKIAQLIVARVEASYSYEYIDTLIYTYKVGGIIPLFPWLLGDHQDLITYVTNSEIPLLVCEDAEWGCSMRIPELAAFPKSMTLGAIPHESSDLVYQVGYAIGMQCKALGIHINFAPVVDVNNNPLNPVIGMRSYGDNAEAVAYAAGAYMQGMSDSGVIPCLKHFPGHGDTTVDSHFDLPHIRASYEQLLQCELVPFKNLCTAASCIMVGHMAVPAFESDGAIRPASCSTDIVQNLLKEQLGFDGLIVSDALDMGALTLYQEPGDIALAVLKAGVDLLVCPSDIPAAISRINDAIDAGDYTEAELDYHVQRVLAVKEKASGVSRNSVELDEYKTLIQEAYDAAATSYNNFYRMPPLDIDKYQSVTVGKPVQLLHTQYVATAHHEPLLIYVYPGGYRIHQLNNVLKDLLHTIIREHPGSIVLLFGSPYCVRDIPDYTPTLVLYEDTPYTHVTAQKIIGGLLMPQGVLPITI